MMLYIKTREEEEEGMIYCSYNTKPLHKLGLWLYDRNPAQVVVMMNLY